MTVEMASAGNVQSERHISQPVGQKAEPILSALAVFSAFCLYWASSFILESRSATNDLGADAFYYAELAKDNVIGRLGSDRLLDRITRFHPLTTGLAVVWMKLLSPLTIWISPLHLLKALFSLIGAVGVWAAMRAFAAVVPRRYVLLLGLIYGTSLGVWFFSSIEESKIVNTTLTALYIATYLQLRAVWTVRRAVLLTGILLAACLNEIVAAFLVAIPAVDMLLQHGLKLRQFRWIVLHALAGPVALAFLELVVRQRLVGTGTEAEGASHISMLLYYLYWTDFRRTGLYGFLVNWIFFNIAAPRGLITLTPPAYPQYHLFEPALANYLSSPASAALALLFGVMLLATLLPRHLPKAISATGRALLAALFTYALLRGLFFLLVNQEECLLFSSGVTLAHMMILGMPFIASGVPAKRTLLAAFAALLFIVNGSFIIGR
jgi:hypothetical protein